MAKILVSIADLLLSRIDREARRLGLTRSAYLARLAERELGTVSGPGGGEPAGRALQTLDELVRARVVPEDATKAIRAERDSR